MGDRGNIVIRSQREGDVWLYTHWGGSELHNDLHAALSRGRDRWSDPSYLARIVFCQMLHGDLTDTTGLGISTRKGDNEHEIVVADTDDQQVLVYSSEYSGGEGKPVSRTSFASYITKPIPASLVES